MAENNEPPAPESAPGRLPVSQPRRNISAERQQQTPPPAGELNDHLADLVDSMMVLANHIGTDPANTADLAKDRSGRRVKKFQRSGATEDQPATLPPPAEGGVAKLVPTVAPVRGSRPTTGGSDAAFNKNVAWPRQGGADQPGDIVPPPARPNKKKKPKKRVVALAVQVAGITLLGLGFVAGRLLSPSPGSEAEDTDKGPLMSKSPDGGSTSRVSEKVLQIANTAVHKAHGGDLDGARKEYEEALSHRVDLPGMYYQLARLALQRNDMLDADLNLDHSSELGEYLTPACYTRARMAAMKGNYTEVVRQFQAAAHTEPFNGRYFFYWAEALRRRGQTKTAIEVFEQALDRAHTAAEGHLYRLKQGFAKIEAGDTDFNAEIDDHLKPENANFDWWMLAAARHVTRSAYPAAAEALKKAAALLPPPVFALQVKDYLFQPAKDDPALTNLLKTQLIQDSTEQNGPFLDPSVLPAELADPAIWPVALMMNGNRP